MRTIDVDAARAFLASEGRLVERRLFATLFEGAPPGGVVDALRGYHNPDGGFGHGLEPRGHSPAPGALAGQPWRSLFGADVVDGHLDRLARDQQPDGGWPLTWGAAERGLRPRVARHGDAARLAVLGAYGR